MVNINFNSLYTRLSNAFLLLISTFIFTGCPTENDNLVNPPSNSTLVFVRAVNLSGDFVSVDMNIGESVLGQINFQDVSNTINPPLDSVDLKVLRNNEVILQPFRKQRFTRNLNYTFFIIPSGPKDSVQRKVDSILVLNSSIVKPNEVDKCLLRFLNVYSDSVNTYSLKLGCQNGSNLATNLQYRNHSQYNSVNSGVSSYTIVKNTSGVETNIGTFEITLSEKLEYLIYLTKGRDEKEEIFLIDENGRNLNSIQKLTALTQTQTQLRFINLTDDFASLSESQGTNIINSIPADNYSDYKLISACSSNSLDKLIINSDKYGEASIFTSLELNQKFTLLGYESNNVLKGFIVKQFRIFNNWNGKSVVRVVNLYDSETSLTVSIGARNDASIPSLNYKAGEILASALPFETMGAANITQSGYLPLTIFNNKQPIDYITGAVENIEANKSYLLILKGKDGEKPKITLVEEFYDGGDKSDNIKYANEGVFYQIANCNKSNDLQKFSLGNIIQNANLYYGSVISGVVEAKDYQLTFNQTKQTLSFKSDKKPIFISIGDKNNNEILDLSTISFDLNGKTIYQRYVNASPDIDSLSLFLNVFGENAIPFLTGLEYKSVTDYSINSFDTKFTLFATNSIDTNLLARVTDIKFSYRKAYTLVFTGVSNKVNDIETGYNMIIIQEF